MFPRATSAWRFSISRVISLPLCGSAVASQIVL